jgi:myo-inositol-1(or 4)-monophosphatase
MIEVAKKAALTAGKIVLSKRGKGLTTRVKIAASDITTEADTLSEKAIVKILQKAFPDHSFILEESDDIEKGSEYYWVIDPLDGTIPYFHQLPTFGISIGLLHKGKPILGVINLPALDCLYWAEKGNGSFLNNEKIHVSDTNKLIDAVIGFDLAHVGDRQDEVTKLIYPLVDNVRYTPILGCTVAGLVYVASGVYDAYIHWAYPWDFVAGAIIVEEAGGKISDYSGKSINWMNKNMSVLTSNGLLHNKIAKSIEK